jgi:1-acyl-sn-glycerol-3-phosphate acyltransferase
MKIFAKIRFYYGAMMIIIVAAGIMVPLMLLFKDKTNMILHKFNAVIMKLIGGKTKSIGKRDNSADMFIINHQGIIDIISMEAAEFTDIRWVAKRQLFDTPWFGYLLRLPNMVNVDRGNRAGLIKLLRDAKETKEETEHHRTLAIFPEGTRTDKQELRAFQNGAKIVAEKLKLKIQPIILTNSKQLLNEHNKTAHSATVYITYLETFTADKSNENWYSDLQKKMQQIIDNEKNSNGRDR